MFPFGKTCAVILLCFQILTKALTIDPPVGSSPTTTITRTATRHDNTTETSSEKSGQPKNSKFKYYTSELLPSETIHYSSSHHNNDNRDDNIVQQKLVDFDEDTEDRQEHRSTETHDHQSGNKKQFRNHLANILPPNILPSCSAANIDLLKDIVQQKEGSYFGEKGPHEFSQQQLLQQYLSMGQHRNPISSHFAKRKAALLQGNRPGKQLVGTHPMGHYYPFYSQKKTTSSSESPSGSRRRLQNHALYNPFKVHPLLMNPFFNPFMPFPVRTHMHPLLLHPLSYQRYHSPANSASNFPRLHSNFNSGPTDGHHVEQQRKQTWDTGSTKGSPNDVRPYQQQQQTKGGKVKRKFDPRKFNSSNNSNSNNTSDSFSSLYNLTPEQIVRLREKLDELKVPKYTRPTARTSGSKEKQSFTRENAFTDASALTRGSDRTVSWSSV